MRHFYTSDKLSSNIINNICQDKAGYIWVGTEYGLNKYDGYRFSDAETHVCNPVSVSAFFAKNYKFSNYWDDTGTPEFLVKLAVTHFFQTFADLEKRFLSCLSIGADSAVK